MSLFLTTNCGKMNLSENMTYTHLARVQCWCFLGKTRRFAFMGGVSRSFLQVCKTLGRSFESRLETVV